MRLSRTLCGSRRGNGRGWRGTSRDAAAVSVPDRVVVRVVGEAMRSTVVRVCAASDEARCPACHPVSRAPHSTYTRRPTDPPVVRAPCPPGTRRAPFLLRRAYLSATHLRRAAPGFVRGARAPHPPTRGGSARGRRRGRGGSGRSARYAARDVPAPAAVSRVSGPTAIVWTRQCERPELPGCIACPC